MNYSRIIIFAILFFTAYGVNAEDDADAVVARQRMFGTYRINFGGETVKFTQLKHYGELYGSPSWYPQFSIDAFAWDWFATAGLRFGAGYYRAGGYAAQARPASDSDAVQRDLDSPINLTLVPIQLSCIFEATPFRAKWLVLSGWAGVEQMYFEESRPSDSSSTATTSSSTSSATSDQPTAGYSNRGWKQGAVVGGAANIRIDYLEKGTANMMADTMGLEHIYFSPFFEIVTASPSNRGANFSRIAYGLSFTFESVR